MVRRRPSVTAPVIDPLVLTHLTDADVTAIEPPLDHHGLRFVDLELSGQNLRGIGLGVFGLLNRLWQRQRPAAR